MIPEKLQDCLIEELKKHFEEFLYPNLKGELVKINIFKQDLPPKKYEEEEDTNFPCIIAELKSGQLPSEGAKQQCKVNFIVCTVKAGSSTDGEEALKWKDNGESAVFSVLNKIYYLLTTEGVIDNTFELQYPLDWEVAEDESEPFNYGSLETSWTVPGVIRKNKEISKWL